MLNAIKTFAGDESGAVTVDWVVLTAALVGLGLAVMGVVSKGVGTMSTQIETGLSRDAAANTLSNFNTAKGGTAVVLP